jgi:hypothetical protein
MTALKIFIQQIFKLRFTCIKKNKKPFLYDAFFLATPKYQVRLIKSRFND